MNRIICGDCLEVMKDMPDKSIDMVFTSPPYNRKRNDKYAHYDDTVIDYYGLIKESIEESLRVSKGYVIFNIQKNYYNKADVFKLFGNFADKIVEVIIWEKSNPMPASSLAITNAYEFFLILGDKPLKSNTTYTKNIITTNVNRKMPESHKAVMKQEVADWFIEKFTREGETILDPFAGTGTTGVAARKLNRNYILIEKEPEYVEIINKRLNLCSQKQK
jgi:modification methylase